MELLFMAYSPRPMSSPCHGLGATAHTADTPPATPEATNDGEDIFTGPTLVDLPLEIVELVLGLLGSSDLLKLQLTCRSFRHYLAPHFWSRLHLNFGKMDSRFSKLTPARHQLQNDVHSTFISIGPGNLPRFLDSVVTGKCDWVLGLVKSLTGDIQFHMSGFPTEVPHYWPCSVHQLLRQELVKRLVNVKNVELRTLLGDGAATDAVLPDILAQCGRHLKNAEISLEMSFNEHCTQLPALQWGAVTRLRLIYNREYSGFAMIRDMFPNGRLPSQVQEFEVGYNYFNAFCTVPAADLHQFLQNTRSLKKLSLDKIQVDNSAAAGAVAWVPGSVQSLHCADYMDSPSTHSLPAYGVTLLQLSTRFGQFFTANSFPMLREVELLKNGPFFDDMVHDHDDSFSSLKWLVAHSPNLTKAHFRKFTFDCVERMLGYEPNITTLIIDEPSFHAPLPEHDTGQDDPGNCLQSIRRIAQRLGHVQHLVIDFERFSRWQLVESLLVLKQLKQQHGNLVDLYIKVLFKRPHRGYLVEAPREFPYESCCKVDLDAL